MSFWKTRTRRDRADDLFSKFIRNRDGWRCQRCGRKWLEGAAGLTASHFFGRRMESVRFDPENVDALCMFPCHDEWENEKGITTGWRGKVKIELPRPYRAWKIEQLGARRFSALEVRAFMTARRDRKMAVLYVKTLMAELARKTPQIVGGKA